MLIQADGNVPIWHRSSGGYLSLSTPEVCRLHPSSRGGRADNDPSSASSCIGWLHLWCPEMENRVEKRF
ncbi:hypothetical protein JTE90_009261 [Oedothorax gibbosus]|uniref:Uncharacterized protein n=1 Tax=Oedothorax gibbosus TaxID=931172 RepID=A0AAV6V1I9_9ARAC|nr:hypothetical protein JTE90_009261 [Oedothorax gibbosus]